MAKSRKLRIGLNGWKPKKPNWTGGLGDWAALKLVARGRIELPTYGFSDRRSPN